MTKTRTSIDLAMPVRSVYNQWTQFEEFPRFMDGIESVTQIDETRLHWVANVAGVTREWDAVILRQVRDKLISWNSTDGLDLSGLVTFEPIMDGTRVTLQMEFNPEGLAESASDLLGIWKRRVDGDLERFKDFIEERGMETGEWRGEITQGEVKVDSPATTSKDADGSPGGERQDARSFRLP